MLIRQAIRYSLLAWLTGLAMAAEADTAYMTTNTAGVHRGGPFDTVPQGADDIVRDIQFRNPGYSGLQWQACYPTTPPGPGGLLVKRSNTACYISGYMNIQYICPVGQKTNFNAPLTTTSCRDYQPTACKDGALFNGSTCVAAAGCPPDLSAGGYASMCAAANAAPKEAGKKPCCDVAGNPIKPGSGQKIQSETVFRMPTFHLELNYNSVPVTQMPTLPVTFGRSWTFNYGMRVWMMAQSNKAIALRADGQVLEFNPPGSGNVYVLISTQN